MGWKRKGGVDRFEGKHCSAKVEETDVSGVYRLKLLDKTTGQWHNDLEMSGERDFCKSVGEKFLAEWDKGVERRKENVEQRKEYYKSQSEFIASLSDEEKQVVKFFEGVKKMKG